MTPAYTPIHIHSRTGSDRATAYDFANHAVEAGGQTFAVWTDVVARTMAARYDHAAGTWDDPVFLGDGCDNHNCPCLTVDREGRLHLAYGPHGAWDHKGRPGDWPSGAFKFATADVPASLAGLEKCRYVGYHATYASLTATAAGLDCLVYRGGESPWSVMFQRQRPNDGWTHARPLMSQEIAPFYTHVGAHLVAAPDNTLYVAGHFYAGDRRLSLGVAILASADLGETWTTLAGKPVATPILYGPDTMVPHPQPADDPRLSGLALAPDARPWVLSIGANHGAYAALLSHWSAHGWQTRDLAPLLPAGWGAFNGTIAFDAAGRLHVLVGAVDRDRLDREPAPQPFGHPSTEIFHLCSADLGETFSCRQVSDTDPDCANWMPSLSQAGPCHPVTRPLLMWTHGRNQLNHEVDGCRHTVETEVHSRFVLQK